MALSRLRASRQIRKDLLGFPKITCEFTRSEGSLTNLMIPIFVSLLSSYLSCSAKGIFLGGWITGGTERSTVIWCVFWRVPRVPKQSWYFFRRAGKFASVWKMRLIKLSFLLVMALKTGCELVSTTMNMIRVTTFYVVYRDFICLLQECLCRCRLWGWWKLNWTLGADGVFCRLLWEYFDFSSRVEFKFNIVSFDVQVHCPRIGLFVVMKSIDGEHGFCLFMERLPLVLRIIKSNHAKEDVDWIRYWIRI